MEPYVRGACIGELESENPTSFDKLQDALDLGPNSKEGGSVGALMKFVNECGGVMSSDPEGCTPLHWAARYDHAKDLVVELLKRGASADGLDKKKMKKFKAAEEEWKLLKRQGSPDGSSARRPKPTDFTEGVPTPLHEASRYDHHEIAELLLLSHRAAFETCGHEDNGQEEMSGVDGHEEKDSAAAAADLPDATKKKKNAKTTIGDVLSNVFGIGSNYNSFPADPNPPDRDGVTPLHICALWDNHKTAQIILKYGGDPSIMNRQGESAVRWASSSLNIQKVFAEWDEKGS